MNARDEARQKAQAAKKASRGLAILDASVKNQALEEISREIGSSAEEILAANARDIEAARGKGRNAAFIDRLTLNDERIQEMSVAAAEIATLPDPVGQVETVKRPNGLEVGRMRVPIGVIGIIYESRPNVTLDAACLCMKSGNAVVLRGGSEAIHSNTALARVISRAALRAGLPDGWLQVIESPDRDAVREMLQLEGLIDLIIPRGGEDLIRAVAQESRIPVIKHYKGVCHVYVDAAADLTKAATIVENAKVQRPGVCNAMETLLVHQKAAGAFLPGMLARLRSLGVEIRGCPETRRLFPAAQEATEADWPAEYLDLILAVRVVDSLDQAVRHIETYGSAHTDAIVTEDLAAAREFVKRVDSASVMVNASTRFSDGGQYGLGAEIGISTDKLHARGPMGLAELTTYKWVVYGDGHIRT